MVSYMNKQKVGKYIPLNASETTVLRDANTLLPRDEIYEPLAEFIRQARDRALEVNEGSLNEFRVHNAISIDGARGTGKTAVQVNLKRYLELQHAQLLDDVHILEPIDPTLLEDGESLFLHIIVASVLHDKRVKQAQREKPGKTNPLNQALDKLAHALEVVETQNERHGLDKVRAMYSNKNLADTVHSFFGEAIKLLDVKLLVLPIDDVDTSLNLAFENLEIIRRYLTTPYVLPIVSGDRTLYQEVTWRDFLGRLTRDSAYQPESAQKTAQELAEEYQRKILPFPRRLSMPEVSDYWQWGKKPEELRVTLGSSSEAIPLASFISWLDVFLTGPVNGQENSRLPIPIPSIRALVQLVSHCSDFIPDLPKAIGNAKNEVEVRRIWQMPTVPLSAMQAFQDKHQELAKEVKREYGEAYQEFFDSLNVSANHSYKYGDSTSKEKIQIKKEQLAGKLLEYFRFEPKAGAINLILLAKMHWQDWHDSVPHARQKGIFDTPLFQPLIQQDTANFSLFDKTEDLSDWPDALDNRLPRTWLQELKSHRTLLPYPVPEVGVNAAKDWSYANDISNLSIDSLNEDRKQKAAFLISLLAQHNFYTNAKKTMLLNIGRIFELVIISITGPVTQEDIQAVLNRAPFYSTSELAPTKTLQFSDKGPKADTDESSSLDVEEERIHYSGAIAELSNEINEWRKFHEIDQIELSPWLVYKVFNKVYSQVTNNELNASGMRHVGTAINIVAHTFYATWSAFGSFEKGALFGLPNIISTTNLNSNRLKNFESHDHFRMNVGPFAPTSSQLAMKDGNSYKNRSTFGRNTRTISYFFADHPIKKWIDEIIEIEWPAPEHAQPIGAGIDKGKPSMTSKEWLCTQLNIPIPVRLTLKEIKSVIANKGHQECSKLLSKMVRIFPKNDSTVANFKIAIEQMFSGNM